MPIFIETKPCHVEKIKVWNIGFKGLKYSTRSSINRQNTLTNNLNGLSQPPSMHDTFLKAFPMGSL